MKAMRTMKTSKALLAVVLAAGLAACGSQPKSEGFTIEGEMADAASGTLYLKCYQEGAFQDVDSTEIQDGKFRFSGRTDEPLAFALTTNKASRRPLVLFLDNGSVRVRLNESEKTLEAEGAPLQDELQRLLARTADEAYTADSLLAQWATSPVAAYVYLTKYSSRMSYEEVDKALDAFCEGLGDHAYTQDIHRLAAKLFALRDGEEAPDFTLPDADGQPVTLSSFRGQYVLVDFWASWCPDCRRENPTVVLAYQRFKDRGFTVLGVSLDRDKDKWQQAIEKDGLTWTHVCDFQYWSGPVVDLYAVKWIPKSFLIGPDGRIIASGLEGQALIDKLSEVLDK